MAKTHPTFAWDDPLCDPLFLTKSAHGNRTSQYREGPLEVLPGIMSNDPEYLHFMDVLSRTLSETFETNVDEWGRVYGNGVRSDFNGIRHVPGYPMVPATVPLASNEYLRSQAGLTNEWVSERDKRIYKAFFKLMIADLECSDLPVKRNSSSMIPWFTKDRGQKTYIMETAIANALPAAELMLKKDYEEAFRRYHIGGAYHCVYRAQMTDSIKYDNGQWIPKDRPVADKAYAMSAGQEGMLAPSDKTFNGSEGFTPPKGFFRTRLRTAMGGPLPINTLLMIVARSVREHIYKEYAYTFHHTTRSAMESAVREYDFMIAGDVSQHDFYWWHGALDANCECMEEMGWDERFIEVYRTKSKLPQFIVNVEPEFDNFLSGDWRNPNNSGGLPSGNAWTDLEGTALMTFVYFLIMAEHTYPEILSECDTDYGALQVAHKFMKGELPIRLLDKSDDAILGWTSPSLVPAAKELQKKMKDDVQVSPYMLVTFENGFAFLGNVFHFPENGNSKEVRLIGNANSYVNNRFAPEYGVYSGKGDRRAAKRPFGGLAWGTRHENYASSPVFYEIDRVIERVWGQVYGESFAARMEAWLAEDEKALLQFERENRMSYSGLSDVDVEVLMDPSRAEWKYAKDDVSEAVRSLLFSSISRTKFEDLFNLYTNYGTSVPL